MRNSTEGRHILKLHKDEGLLSNTSRRKLCNLIVHDLLSEDPYVRIPNQTLHEIAHEIKSIFAKENVCTYFVPPVNNKQTKVKSFAKGKLYDCLQNRKREYRSAVAGKHNPTLKDHQKHDKSVVQEQRYGSQQDIVWLQNSTVPWKMVEEKWQKTTKLRTSELTKSEKTVTKYMTEFPCLQKPAGYSLLLIDFRQLYPEKDKLFYENFPYLKSKILSHAAQKAKRDALLNPFVLHLEKISEVDDVTANEAKSIAALAALPLLLSHPISKVRKTSWRPSKEEASESFITHICTPMELQVTILKRKEEFLKHNATLPPFIVIVGRDFTTIEKYYVVVNDTLYVLRTILDAVDLCFKAFHVLNCRYPVECIATWQVIQKGLFQLQTPWDKNLTSVYSFLTDIGVQIE